MAQMNTLIRTTKRKAPSIGRGGKRGKTSGRGGKGQTARAGNKIRPEIRDMIKKLPKWRGYGKNRARTVNDERPVFTPVAIEKLSGFTVVSVETLFEKGIIKNKSKRNGNIKLLGKIAPCALTVEGCMVSASAKLGIEKAGGTVK